MIRDGYTINSNETNHSRFTALENKHGTFLFHAKDLNLLNSFIKFKIINLDYFRLDLRHLNLFFLKKALNLVDKFSLKKMNNFNKLYPNKITKGYFSVNKSDIIFEKLKNKCLQDKGFNYLGEIIESVKNEYLVIYIKNGCNSLKKGQCIKMINPLGFKIYTVITSLKNLNLQEVCEVKSSLAIINYISNAHCKTLVYIDKKKF